MLKRVCFSFAISGMCGLIVYMLMEFVGEVLLGAENFSGLTPEYMTYFPSETLALGTAVLFHGLIGAAFCAATVVYEKAELGFVLQNVIYFIVTGAVWIPVVSFVWQLYRYPAAFFSTLGGFVMTYIIMSVVGYNITKKEVAQINALLAEEN
ncbi:MAG: DUF3021 family protein [Lachnospiraceae bacterium]|nr:DUF3021 family protein [Lachnospiraceae bacterium]